MHFVDLFSASGVEIMFFSDTFVVLVLELALMVQYPEGSAIYIQHKCKTDTTRKWELLHVSLEGSRN